MKWCLIYNRIAILVYFGHTVLCINYLTSMRYVHIIVYMFIIE